ncbi:phosphotransferase family protein [Actinoplanes sp. RD1]|uniref:phosphotransferase family protein n=1 Tax=Actinoplanes sp. RD1 TaxID=3064538 RepID=UPI0027416097|nr:phosphotransferase [Actinoplanes sp. RD1]
MLRAVGVRIGWADLPRHIRARVEAALGGPVASARSQHGGFSPGTADRVMTRDGRRAFVKAVSTGLNPTSVAMARREARVTSLMPPGAPVPRLLDAFEDDTDGETWMVMVLEDIEGRHPHTPWTADEVDAVLRALRELELQLTPSPMPGLDRAGDRLAPQFAGWDLLAAEPMTDLHPWARAHLDELRAAAQRGLAVLRTGATVAHCDLRADNLLVRPDGRVVVVDWPAASVAPAWLDRLQLAMDVTAHGGDGDALISDIDPGHAVDVWAGFTGYLLERSRHPSPGIPFVRDFQRALADALLPWLTDRMGR